MEKMAFKTTENTSREAMVKYARVILPLISRSLEDIGANVITRCGRDSIFYSVDTLRGNVEKCVQMLAESVMCPRLMDNEIEEASVGTVLRHDA